MRRKSSLLQTILLRLLLSLTLVYVWVFHLKTPTVLAQFQPEITVLLSMWELDSLGNKTATPCIVNSVKSSRYGCTYFDQVRFGANARQYPYATNIVSVNIEKDYLLDVVTQEMGPDTYQSPIALYSQAVAARSYAHWKIENIVLPTNTPLTNSVNDQAFIPYRFEGLTENPTYNVSNSSNPCSSQNLITTQQLICSATNLQHYLALDGTDAPAFAEFSADARSQTIANLELLPNNTRKFPYLESVSESISTKCDTDTIGSHQRGMSQRGANRWARGHECSHVGAPVAGNNAPGGPWTVRWTKPEQILFHYYTDVNLRDASNNNAILSASPQFRWNPLEIQGGVPSQFTSPNPYSFFIWVQNTGTTTWNCISQSTGAAKSNTISTKIVAVPSGVTLTSTLSHYCVYTPPGQARSLSLVTVNIPAYC